MEILGMHLFHFETERNHSCKHIRYAFKNVSINCKEKADIKRRQGLKLIKLKSVGK